MRPPRSVAARSKGTSLRVTRPTLVGVLASLSIVGFVPAAAAAGTDTTTPPDHSTE